MCMFKQKVGRLLTLILCVGICVCLLISCSTPTQGEKDEPAKPTPTAGENQPADPDEQDEKYFNEVGVPIVKEPITLKLMLRYDAARGTEPKNNDLWAYLQELT